MRRFTFKLEKVLELRRQIEREWEIQLAHATGKVISVEQEIRQWGERRHATVSVGTPLGPVDTALLQSREEYVGFIHGRVDELQHRLVALETERDRVREGYLKVSRARKALTKLKERRESEYYKHALREEAKAIDEIAGTQTVRRIRESEEIDV